MVHPRRTTCLLQVGSQLWAGSVDRTVAVLDAATRTPVATLDGLADMVVAMAVTPAMRVWVAAGAELTCFRADTHQRDGAAVMLPPDAAGRPVFVHALAAVGDEQLWVGTGRSLFIIDMATRSILAQFPPPPRTPTPPPASDPSVASLDLSVATDPDMVSCSDRADRDDASSDDEDLANTEDWVFVPTEADLGGAASPVSSPPPVRNRRPDSSVVMLTKSCIL
jgi:hypothetical protein